MSSRNRYLTAAQRRIAPALHAALAAAVARIEAGSRNYAALCAEAVARLQEQGFKPEYFEVRDAVTLAPATPEARSIVLLAAAWLGRARLIDNLRVDL